MIYGLENLPVTVLTQITACTTVNLDTKIIKPDKLLATNTIQTCVADGERCLSIEISFEEAERADIIISP